MLHSRSLNSRINRIHERSLRIVYKASNSTFEELLKEDKSCTVDMRNMQYLAIELYKVVNGIASDLMTQTFTLKENNIYCSKFIFKTRNVDAVHYRTESLGHLGSKIWSLIPKHLKEIDSLRLFKSSIKQWNPKNVPVEYPNHIYKT